MDASLTRADAIIRIAAVCLQLSAICSAQEIPRPYDPLGLAVREGRTHVGGDYSIEAMQTAFRKDMWLCYMKGEGYFRRDWSKDDKVFSMQLDHPAAGAATSCAMCHNLPYPSPGYGGSTHVPIGYGRNTPHLFGVGLVESLGLQIRADILYEHDANRNGFLDVPAEVIGRTAIVKSGFDKTIDFGRLDDFDNDGFPDLNEVITVTFRYKDGSCAPKFDDAGQIVDLTTDGIAGYDIDVACFGASSSDHQFSTIRDFTIGVLNTVMGLPVSELRSEKQSRIVSPAGAPQPRIDLTDMMSPTSSKIPSSSIQQFEVDLIEWYLLNSPRPGIGRSTDASRNGEKLLGKFLCTKCHVKKWALAARNDSKGALGDRRFFDLSAEYNLETKRMEGRLKYNCDDEGVINHNAYEVQDIYTDFLHHDMGKRFYEYELIDQDVFVRDKFRTFPLWGVGSTPPYGHDGASPTLDHVIRRHGGEGRESMLRYTEAPQTERNNVLAYLRSLVLYSPRLLPVDLDADGSISEMFRVRRNEVGPETFRPELFFRTAPKYRGWTVRDRERFFSLELLNASEAYGWQPFIP